MGPLLRRGFGVWGALKFRFTRGLDVIDNPLPAIGSIVADVPALSITVDTPTFSITAAVPSIRIEVT